MNVKSITDQSNLEEFLSTAELAGQEFTAEKDNATLVAAASGPSEVKSQVYNHSESFSGMLAIPRRPEWNDEMTKSELVQLEKSEFLKWRRRLAKIQESKDLIVTPFEKNLEFWRQLWRVVEKSDVLVQVVDARNPLLFYCRDLDVYVKEVDPRKKSVVLMNKSDYLTSHQLSAWKEYFSSIGVQVLFFSAVAEDEESNVNPHQSVLPSQQLVEELKTIAESAGPKLPDIKYVTIGLVGYPNVGKSSTINALLKVKKVSISATPGKTKHFQTLFLSEDLCLCDCPGLVFPNFVSSKAEMVINGILPIHEMTDHVSPINLVASLFSRRVFECFYNINLKKNTDEPLEAEELLNAYGYARGFMTPRGLPNQPKTARLILKDFVSGELLYCVAPPGVEQETFHEMKVDEIHIREMTPFEKRVILGEASAVEEDDFDEQFFKKNAPIGARTMTSSMSGLTLGQLPPKGWKTKLNRNKKEKLRRVYSHLDQ